MFILLREVTTVISQIFSHSLPGQDWVTTLERVTDSEFGEAVLPTFLDNVNCMGTESRLMDCNEEIGLISGDCACDGCVQELGVKCPGMYVCTYVSCGQ